MNVLRTHHPDSDFGPVMRPYFIDVESDAVQKATGLEAGDAAPPGSKFQYRPKIKCYVSNPLPCIHSCHSPLLMGLWATEWRCRIDADVCDGRIVPINCTMPPPIA